MTTCASDQRDFTQTDPLPYGPGSTFESAYAYAGNNPVVYTDPSGLRKKSSYQSGLDFIGSEMPSNSMWAQKYGIDGCRGWIVGFTCYKEQLVVKGPTFASKVGNGKPMDYKSNKGFLNSINHESFTLIEPDLNPITHSSVSIRVDTWGNIHYGWIGRVFKIHVQDLLDGSHGKLHVFGPFFKHLSAKEAGTTQLADDEAVKAGFEMFDRCGDSCSRSDLDDALRRVAPKLMTADMKDKTPGAHARTK